MNTRVLHTIAAGLVLSATSVSAQATDCATTASIAYEHAKVKNYEAAEEPLWKVRKECPTHSVATFQFGKKLLESKYKKATGAEKATLANELIALWKERFQYFPAKTKVGDMHSDIGQIMYDNKIGTADNQFVEFHKAYTDDKNNFKRPKKLYTYFSLLVDLQAAGKKELQDVFDLYDNITEKIEDEESKKAKTIATLSEKEESGAALSSKEKRNLKNAGINLRAYSKVKGGINQKLGELADCKNLIPLYNGQFEGKKDDINWLKGAAGRMSTKECTDDPLFFKLVEALHKADPSAKSAYYLGILALKDKKTSKALEYFNQSAQLETKASDKAKVYFRIGEVVKKQGNYSKARSYYKKALANKPSYGTAYLRIAAMIAKSANSCGTDVFSKRAVYWLAERYARKAGKVDPSLKKTAAATAANYKAKAPSKTDIFNNPGITSVKIGCWIGETVKVPKL
ncbi:tetratricopeptide repeat protein [Aquimarina sp. BL5]|uniref:tetratricopeptide repeat protein n=1 Tax=Aquimarina sp. BL5 TaxID=1714860 RepID=UPI000E50B9D3|nr:tetratricopeptide repeat protein [Aquimarina sp. BL5]AXT52507.1 tetratricopeptide repeat protein [Aquimarina sp. BL5]RKN08482.1 tetratricopeptide repeat protein [Aquimarina sp. BL5]